MLPVLIKVLNSLCSTLVNIFAFSFIIFVGISFSWVALDFFDNAVKHLEINENQYILSNTIEIDDPVDIAVEKYKSHLSILAIKENVSSSVFHFKTVTLNDIENEISNLDSTKNGNYSWHSNKTPKRHQIYVVNIY